MEDQVIKEQLRVNNSIIEDLVKQNTSLKNELATLKPIIGDLDVKMRKYYDMYHQEAKKLNMIYKQLQKKE